MKIVVDYDLCESNAICMQIAPDIFEVRDDDFIYVLNEEPGEEDRARVEECVQRRCGIAAPVAGLDRQKIGQQTQGVLLALARLEDLLHTVGTEDHSDPVMVVYGGKSEQCRQLVHRIPLGAARFGAILSRHPAGGRNVHD